MRAKALAPVIGLALLMGLGATAQAATDPEIRVLSNRADLISGGDALVQVQPAGAKIDLNGRDITSQFAARPDGRNLALVTGLVNGENALTARTADGGGARVNILNHPIGGPVLAGPQIQPWTCFDGALDKQCDRPPTYEFFYKSTGGGSLQSYDPKNPPSDVATTTTDNGKTVPFIVRQETGELDRDEYRIAVLYDPSKPWAPWAPQEGFNHKLVIFHGASCDTEYQQASAPDVLNETALGKGFVTMSHALDNAGHNCNIATQAESLIMTKERVIEQYGELRYTIGSGCSGGSLVQQQLANAYPGLYQGITPACSLTDAWSSAMQYGDYQLLRRYFEDPSKWGPGVAWSPEKIQAVEGHPNPVNAVTFTEVIPSSGDPSRSCPGLSSDKVYDPKTNPKGVRCSFQDYMVNVFGRRPQDGFAGRPADNVGVEYGLKALIAGKISPADFADLNAKIGDWDIDYNPTVERVAADRPALERVYKSGAVDQADNLDKVAIIDLRGPDPGAFHDAYRTQVMRARLDRNFGTAANQVLWRVQVPLFGDPDYADESILAVDKWLSVVEADPRAVPLAQKIIQDKPKDVTDRCTDGNDNDVPADECDAVVQAYTDPRIESGMPFADDTIKCDLKPLRRTGHLPYQFSDAEWGELEKTFPSGVCDYTKPGVDRVPTTPWQSYQDEDGNVIYGGRGLGAVPVAEPLNALGLRSASRCVSRRPFRIRLRGPHNERLRSARVYVGGRRVAVLKGRRAARPLTVRRVPKGSFRVRIVATTRAGKRVVVQRRYRICARKKKK